MVALEPRHDREGSVDLAVDQLWGPRIPFIPNGAKILVAKIIEDASAVGWPTVVTEWSNG